MRWQPKIQTQTNSLETSMAKAVVGPEPAGGENFPGTKHGVTPSAANPNAHGIFESQRFSNNISPSVLKNESCRTKHSNCFLAVHKH